MKTRVLAFTIFLALAAVLFLSAKPKRILAQTMLGGPLSGLTSGQLTRFNSGMTEFETSWDPIHGLGPVYTNTSCINCHATPAIGGYNGTDRVTYFGKLNSDGTFNPLLNEGGIVLQPLSVSKFIPGCTVAGEVIPSDANLITRNLPPPLFGAGLIDAVPDADIEANAVNKGMGVDGMVNMVTDWNGQSRVGHFGYKAQYASLLYSTGFQFNTEIGITNPVSRMENCPQGNCKIPPTCIKRRDPNDPNGVETIQLFDFESFLAPPTPGSGNSNGQALFTSVGCILCHTQSYTTPPNVQIPSDFHGHTQTIQALSNQTLNLYSDLLLHHMGTGLADGFPFGMANGDQFRTTPLWGLSFRTVYLHDGRANNLTSAIQDHSVNGDGEAAQVVQNFNALSPQDQADLIAFISSL